MHPYMLTVEATVEVGTPVGVFLNEEGVNTKAGSCFYIGCAIVEEEGFGGVNIGISKHVAEDAFGGFHDSDLI